MNEQPQTDLVRKSDNIIDKIQAAIPKLLKVNPLDERTAHRAMDVLVSLVKSPSIRGCEQNSILIAALNVAKLGLIPDPQIGHVYLVPFKGKATVIIGYKGFIELARRAGGIMEACELVYEGDEFEFGVHDGKRIFNWKPHWIVKKEKGNLLGGFTILLYNGERICRFIPKRIIDERRSRSASVRSGKQSPWDTDGEAMELKTIIRASSSFWTLSTELQRAVSIDIAQEDGHSQGSQIDASDLGIEIIDDAEPTPTAASFDQSGAKTKALTAEKPTEQKPDTGSPNPAPRRRGRPPKQKDAEPQAEEGTEPSEPEDDLPFVFAPEPESEAVENVKREIVACENLADLRAYEGIFWRKASTADLTKEERREIANKFADAVIAFNAEIQNEE